LAGQYLCDNGKRWIYNRKQQHGVRDLHVMRGSMHNVAKLYSRRMYCREWNMRLYEFRNTNAKR